LTGADLRGARAADLSSAIVRSTILPTGHIQGLILDAGEALVVRDCALPIVVENEMNLGPGSTLRMLFDSSSWSSTIAFDYGIPVTLGGDLDLSFATDGWDTKGATYHLFDWRGVTPNGQFRLVAHQTSEGYWDTSQLYTTGNVTYVPEPSAFALLGVGALGLLAYGRRRWQRAA
jgi:hypothetical protein